MDENTRYADVQANIKQLLDDAAADSSPMGIANLGRVILAAELYWRNEQAHSLHEARIGCVRALERRIQAMQIKDCMERLKATKQEQESHLTLPEEES